MFKFFEKIFNKKTEVLLPMVEEPIEEKEPEVYIHTTEEDKVVPKGRIKRLKEKNKQ